MLREQLRAARREGSDADALLAEGAETERQAREAIAKAQGIEDAAYDLKAVNPREVRVTDTRTPAQLLDAIEHKGREVDGALVRLRSLLGTPEA